MESNVVEVGGTRDCACGSGTTLAVLQEVQRAHQQRIALIDKIGGPNKLKKKVDVLQAWVADVVAQNTLMAKTIEDLEKEATNRLLKERARHSELMAEARAEAVTLRRAVARKDSDVRALLEVLRRLREFDYCTLDGIHFFEVTESDIFGSVKWRQEKLEQGDGKKKPSSEKKSKRHR